jgi:hypothetical protein
MDGIAKKKWFVYLTDHHEGPDTIHELSARIARGQVTKETYVWAEGMPDWQLITEVSEVANLLQPPQAQVQVDSSPEPAPTTPIQVEATPTEAVTLEAITLEPGAELAPVEPQPSGPSEPILVASAPEPAELEITSAGLAPLEEASAEPSIETQVSAQADSLAIPQEEPSPETKPSRRWLSPRKIKWIGGIVAILLIAVGLQQGWINLSPLRGFWEGIAGVTRPGLVYLSEKLPFMSSWVSPLPVMDDVSPEEYEELKAAARGRAEVSGAQIALALSKSDAQSPSFYIASNLPDSTQFQVFIVGISDTLLNHVSFGSQAEVSLTQKIGKTNPIRFADGRPIPKGEYTIYVVPFEGQPIEAKPLLATLSPVQIKLPSALPPNSKVLVYKTYFLGGTRDAMYAARLKEYHDKLRAKATSETNEIKQFTATLDSQLSSTLRKFSLIRLGKLSSSQRKTWESFHNEWMKLQGQLDQIFHTWTAEAIQNQYFYGVLYRMTQDAGNQIEKVHGFQHAYFNGAIDAQDFNTQLKEAVASAQTSIQALRTKTEQAEKMGLTPSGMPQREGL